MVRRLDQTLPKHIKTILGTKLSVEAIRGDEIDVLSPKLIKGEKVIIPMSNSQIAGFALVDAIDAYSKLVLSTVSDRKIFEQGQSSLKFLYWAALLAAILLAAFSWLLDKLVLTRLARLNENVKQIGEFTSSSGRVQSFSGNDEMSGVAQGIKGMQQRLDQSQLALQF